MRAMVLDAVGSAEGKPLRLEKDRADPRPRAGEVVIAVEACGVCRTDLHILEGEVTARLPIVLGHQAAGRIAQTGDGVEDFRAGDLVGVGWLASTCGLCRFCRSGRENLCENATFTGRDRDGGYAEKMSADSRSVYPLPEGFTADQAAPLLCAGIIGYRSLLVSGVPRGGNLGLFGFGASAHLAMQVALHWKCRVYAFTREEPHRRLARELGATWAGDISDDAGVALDAAVTFAPAGEVVIAALERLDRGASVAVNAIHMGPIPSFAYERLYGERVVRSVMNYTRRDAREFLALAAKIPIEARTEIFPLERANEALSRIERGTVAGAAVLKI